MKVFNLKVIVSDKVMTGKYSTLEKAVTEANRLTGKTMEAKLYFQQPYCRWLMHAASGEFPTAQIDHN